jgi:hypothetical protein
MMMMSIIIFTIATIIIIIITINIICSDIVIDVVNGPIYMGWRMLCGCSSIVVDVCVTTAAVGMILLVI